MVKLKHKCSETAGSCTACTLMLRTCQLPLSSSKQTAASLPRHCTSVVKQLQISKSGHTILLLAALTQEELRLEALLACAHVCLRQCTSLRQSFVKRAERALFRSCGAPSSQPARRKPATGWAGKHPSLTLL